MNSDPGLSPDSSRSSSQRSISLKAERISRSRMEDSSAVGPSAQSLMEMKECLDDITRKLRPLIEDIREGRLPTKNGLSYLEVKHLLLFTYSETLVYYILCKSQGRSVKDHPLWLRLVEIKFFLEKIRPIDKKLEYQIQKLLKAGQTLMSEETGVEAAKEDALAYRPNPDMLVSKLDQTIEEGGGVYRPPMLAPAAMQGEETGRDRRTKVRSEKEMQRRASRSAFIRELANELEGRPEEVREVVGTESKELLRDRARLEKRAEEEEDLFARVPLSKSDRNKVKKLNQSRSGLSGMLDDFEDDIVDIANMDDTQHGKSNGLPYRKSSKQRTLSQMAGEAEPSFKKSKYGSSDMDAPEELQGKARKHKSKKLRR